MRIGENTEPFLVGTSLQYKGCWVTVYMTEEQLFRSVMGNPDFEQAMESDYRKQIEAAGYRPTQTSPWWKFWL